MKAIPLFLALLLAVHGIAASRRPPAAVRLRVENMTAPEGLATLTPRFSWQINDAQPGSRQTHYRILVASRPELLMPGKADLWDSGLTASDAQLWLRYAGRPLRDCQRAYWTVQTTTNHGTSPWAAAQPFSTGLTAECHWQGRWIGIDSCLAGSERRGYYTRLAARYLRHEITLRQQPIARATAYIAAVGLYELYVNGSRQDARHVMKPAFQQDYPRTLVAETQEAKGEDLKDAPPYYALTMPYKTERATGVTVITLSTPHAASAATAVERIEGRNWIGVSLRHGAHTTHLYINELADGRLMHSNSWIEADGWQTDARMLVVCDGRPTLIVYGSALRRDGRTIFSSLTKQTKALIDLKIKD